MCVGIHVSTDMTDPLVDKDNYQVPFPGRSLHADNKYHAPPQQCRLARMSCMGNSPHRQKHKKYRVTFEVHVIVTFLCHLGHLALLLFIS